MSDSVPPPGGHREAVSILPVPKAGKLAVLFLAPIQGLNTHWHGGRSFPCRGVDDCPAPIHKARSVWKGYAPVETWDQAAGLWRPRVLEVTEVLEEQLRGRELRGEVWLLWRTDCGRRSSPIHAAYVETRSAQDHGRSFDISPPLLRFYHVPAILLGVPNPLPSKIMLPAVARPGPRIQEVAGPVQDDRPTTEQMAKLREMARQLGGRTRAANQSPTPDNNGKR